MRTNIVVVQQRRILGKPDGATGEGRRDTLTHGRVIVRGACSRPSRKVIAPATRNSLPLAGIRVKADGRQQNVVTNSVNRALQRRTIVRHIGRPTVVNLHVQPPCPGMHILAGGIIYGIYTRVVAEIVGQTLLIAQAAVAREIMELQRERLFIASIDVQRQIGEPMRFVEQARVGAKNQSARHAHNAERRALRRLHLAIRPRHVVPYVPQRILVLRFDWLYKKYCQQDSQETF